MKLSFFARVLKAMVGSITVLFLFVSCQMPTFSFYKPVKPSESLAEFMEAINTGDEEKANEYLTGCKWSNQTDESLSPYEKNIADALSKSRSCTIKEQSFIGKDERSVRITVSLTVFNMNRFEKTLTEAVKNDVKQQMYEGTKFSDSSETQSVIEQHTEELLNEPERYYTVSEHTFDMYLSKNKWHIDMTDDFYHALLGIC